MGRKNGTQIVNGSGGFSRGRRDRRSRRKTSGKNSRRRAMLRFGWFVLGVLGEVVKGRVRRLWYG